VKLSWSAGARIRMLPPLLRPFAVLARNALVVTGLKQAVDDERSGFRTEVFKKLELGVDYVYSCDVAGDIAEFGTMTGGTAAALARAMALSSARYPEAAGRTRRLHLFDSFRGLPEASSPIDAESPHVRSGVWSAGTCKGISRDDLLRRCVKYLPEDRVAIHDGWFKDTLPRLPADVRFALLHIDCDLYQSTIEVLDHCFSRSLIQEGTAIFFDDWNSNRASPEFGERKAWAEACGRYAVRSSDCGEYSHSGRKFIVHSYRPAASPG
jgi:O-methyltransferase